MPAPKPAALTPPPPPASPEATASEDEIAYLVRKHRVSAAVVREIIRRAGTGERSAVEREIRKGLMRR